MTMKRFITLSGMERGGSIETVHKGFLAESCQNYRVIVRREELDIWKGSKVTTMLLFVHRLLYRFYLIFIVLGHLNHPICYSIWKTRNSKILCPPGSRLNFKVKVMYCDWRARKGEEKFCFFLEGQRRGWLCVTSVHYVCWKYLQLLGLNLGLVHS